MKLYATVQSERASKGQGGNFLNIIVKDENKQEIARLVITKEDNGTVIAYDYDEDVAIFERWHNLEMATANSGKKGEKQKGDECNDCDLGVTEYPTTSEKRCSWCGRKR